MVDVCDLFTNLRRNLKEQLEQIDRLLCNDNVCLVLWKCNALLDIINIIHDPKRTRVDGVIEGLEAYPALRLTRGV